MIKQYRIDSKVTFEIWRAGKLLRLQATLNKRPAPANELPEYEDKDLEYTVRELSFADRVFLIPPENGGGRECRVRRVGLISWFTPGRHFTQSKQATRA